MRKFFCWLVGHEWKFLKMKRGEMHMDWEGPAYKMEYHSKCIHCPATKVDIPADEDDY